MRVYVPQSRRKGLNETKVYSSQSECDCPFSETTHVSSVSQETVWGPAAWLWVKVLPQRPDDQNSISGTYVKLKGGN